MSRALTVFSRKDREGDTSEVEKVMESQGCSEPVARNLLKYAKLGIGPLASSSFKDDDRRDEPQARDAWQPQPARVDRRAAALEFEQRLREREEQEEREFEARFQQGGRKKGNAGLPRLGPVMARKDEVDPFGQQAAFEQPLNQKDETSASARQPMAKKKLQIGGITSLGPVVARREEVDPLNRDVPLHERQDEDDEPSDDGGAAHSRQAAEKFRKLQLEEEKRRQQQQQGKRKRRRRGREADDRSEESDRGHEDEVEGRETKRVFTDKGSRLEKPRSESPQPGPSEQPRRGAPSANGLMSEAEVMAMMGKNRRNEKRERGSVRAKTRIQKEMEEWERAKAQNPEFWKPPQFALCYSAETGKRQGPY